MTFFLPPFPLPARLGEAIRLGNAPDKRELLRNLIDCTNVQWVFTFN